jgi:hypothetical protein
MDREGLAAGRQESNRANSHLGRAAVDWGANSPGALRDEDARQSRRGAAVIQWGLTALGVIAALRVVLTADFDSGIGSLARVMVFLSAAYQLGMHAVAGLALAMFIRRLAALGWSSSGAQPLATAPHSSAVAASQPGFSGGLDEPGGSGPDRDGGASRGSEFDFERVRLLISQRRFTEAESLLELLSHRAVGDPALDALRHQWDEAIRAQRDELMAKIAAARGVNDAQGVLELRELLLPSLDASARESFDADLANWFLRLIHHRLRQGRIQVETVTLAGRIAEAFGHTTEGASLRASLPMLRRSVGLCPKCAQVYTGLGDACPACLKTPIPDSLHITAKEDPTPPDPMSDL